MVSAILYTLQRCDWQFFGTLTFRSGKVPQLSRLLMWSCLRSSVCNWFKVRPQVLGWVLRQESGEITGRLHFHFLLCGLPSSAVNLSSCVAMGKQWERVGGGIARVRLYDSAAVGSPEGAGEYLCKCLGTDVGANLYETSKFSSSPDGLLVSGSVWRGRQVRRHSVPSSNVPHFAG